MLDVFETGLLNSKWRSVNVVHLLPVMLENVVSNYATQAMTYNEDTVVLAATVQLAEELDAVSTDTVAHGDVLGCRA